MTISKTSLLACLCAGLILTGLGCSKGSTIENTTDSQAQDSAKQVEFIAGDTFVIKQNIYGLGSFLSGLGSETGGARNVTITRFAPGYGASLDWNMTLKSESASSVAARDAYAQDLKDGKATGLPPKPEFNETVTSGSIQNINLRGSHSAYFPSYWEATSTLLNEERSAIWLSEDGYQELTRTGRTVLNYGIFDESFERATKGFATVKQAMDEFRKKADEAATANTDLTLMQVDPSETKYELMVNGEKKTVSIIKARNWFGEVWILNNQQNPMILKAKLNPFKSSVGDAIAGNEEFFNQFFGFEVTDIQLKR